MNLPSTGEAAKAEGLTRYDTGKPCIRGHLSPRQASNNSCIECLKINRAKFKAENREKVLGFTRSWVEKSRAHIEEYRAANKDKKAENYQKRRAADPEKFREIARQYRAKNKEVCSERVRKAVEKRSDYYKAKGKEWRDNNPDVTTAATQRYRAAKDHRTVSWANHDVIRDIFRLAKQSGLTVDHIVPLRGELVCGLHVENNLQLLTLAENVRKGNKFDPMEFEMVSGIHPSLKASIAP